MATSKTPERESARLAACRHRFMLQDAARSLVPHERVARCCRYIRPDHGGVELLHSPAEGRAHFAGVEVCGSVWLCPVCASRVAEERRRELVHAVNYWREHGGGSILFATYTVRHGRGDDLQALLDRFGAAYRRLTGHRAYRALSAAQGLLYSVRALEVTHGEGNGWHPHYHVLLFFGRVLTPAEITAWELAVYGLWAGAAGREGLDMLRGRGLRLERTYGAVADYVAKHGRDPQSDPWGPESELTKAHVKTGSRGGDTPRDLLRRAAAGDGRAAHLWREYAAVFKGRQQLVWSPGFRWAVGLADDAGDAQIAAAVPADVVHLGWLGFEEWALILRYRMRADVLDVAACGEWSAVLALVADLRRRRRAELLARRGDDRASPRPRPAQLFLHLAGQQVAGAAQAERRRRRPAGG